MTITYSPPRHEPRLSGFAITVLIHLVLLWGWQVARQPKPDDTPEPTRMLLWTPQSAPKAALLPPPISPLPPPALPRPAFQIKPPAVSAAPEPALPPPEAETPAVAPPVSAQELLLQAKRGIGKIDKDLREAYPGQPITAPVVNERTKLLAGLQKAADNAPPKWYEAPKVTEILDSGPYGRRRYKVVDTRATYCVTYETNRSPDGQDMMTRGIQPKNTNCPPHEQAATKQDYSKPIGYGKPAK